MKKDTIETIIFFLLITVASAVFYYLQTHRVPLNSDAPKNESSRVTEPVAQTKPSLPTHL
jgi:hypothetical protein